MLTEVDVYWLVNLSPIESQKEFAGNHSALLDVQP